ncbi:MAG: YihY family inner membrane protein [Candidatus Delongbacteria bacterium]|nr:YihY family inner membrane protein [Candidatus Delongbacteria bacterium]
MTKFIKKARKFLTHDLWFTDIEDSFTGAKRFFMKELQMLVLEIKLLQRNNLFSRASALAFTTLLSLIPVLAILFMFFKAFGGKMVEEKIKPMILEFLASGAGDTISEYIDSFLSSATVDALGSIGAVFLLVAVYSILSSIERSFNMVWQMKKDRSPIEQLKTYLSIVFIAPVLLIISIWLAGRLEFIIQAGDNVWGGFSTFILFQLVPFFLIMLMFIFLLIIMPNTKVKLKHAVVGSFIGAILYTILKAIFIHYTKLAGSYGVIYGSLAALPFFMLWIYFSWIIVLLSVQITFVRQNIHNLKHMEINVETNRADKIKITLMITLKILKDFVNGNERSNLYEISSTLDIPLKDANQCIAKLEQSGIIIEIAKKHDAYTLNIPIKQLTVDRVVNAVDKMYLESKNYHSESSFPEIKKILSENNEIVAEKGSLLSNFLDKKE